MQLFKALKTGHLGVWIFIIWIAAVVIKATIDSI